MPCTLAAALPERGKLVAGITRLYDALMRSVEPSARNRALIGALEALEDSQVSGVTEPRLERWRGWRRVGVIPRNEERWRGFAVGRTVPAAEVERVAAVARLCRHRRSLDEVAVRLALTEQAVAPVALAEVREERPDLWARLAREVAPPILDEGEPLSAELRILPSGHVRAFYVLAPDGNAPPSYSAAALPRILADDGPASILVGVRGSSKARRETEQEEAGECIECGARVYVTAGAQLRKAEALLCDICAAKG